MPLITIRNLEFTANVRVSQTVSFVSIPTHKVADHKVATKKVATKKVAADLRAAENSAQPIPAYSATWEIIADDPDKRPAKGDIIVDQDGTEWHVHKVTMIAHRGVWQCQAYAPITGFLPHETVNILRPFATVSENGLTTTAWRRVKSNLSAKLIGEGSRRPPGGGKSTANEHNLRAYHREYLPLQKHDLLELPDGRQYKITRTRNSHQTHGWTEWFLKINPNPVNVAEK